MESGEHVAGFYSALAVGSTLFSSFSGSFAPGEITIEQSLSTVLGALALFMLGIFGPGIAAGLVSGAPQLGAGAVVGPAVGLAVAGTAVGSVALGGARTVGAAAGGATRAASSMAGGATGAYTLGRTASGATGAAGVAAGAGGIARASAGAVGQGARSIAGSTTAGIRQSYQGGQRGAITASGGKVSDRSGNAASSALASSDGGPDWARKLRRDQRLREGATVAAHTIRDGDRPAAGENPRLREDD
jgi:type IV secretion system protein TrbL